MYKRYMSISKRFSTPYRRRAADRKQVLDPLTKPLILRCAFLSHYWYCLRRRALAQVRCAVLSGALISDRSARRPPPVPIPAALRGIGRVRAQMLAQMASITSIIRPLTAPRTAAICCNIAEQSTSCSSARSSASAWPLMRRTRVNSFSCLSRCAACARFPFLGNILGYSILNAILPRGADASPPRRSNGTHCREGHRCRQSPS